MMRRPTYCLTVLAALACSVGVALPQDQSDAAIDRAVERAKAGQVSPPTAAGRETCAVLKAAVVPADFGVSASALRYKTGSMEELTGQALCMVAWDRPDKDAINAAYTKAITAYIMAPKAQRGERPKPPRLTNDLSLTIMGQKFSSPAEAVASLEQTVAQLSTGVTRVVRGKEYTTKIEFEDWLDGVGDKAAWSPKYHALHVAANGRRFSVFVQVFDDEAENIAHAIELAKRIIAKL